MSRIALLLALACAPAAGREAAPAPLDTVLARATEGRWEARWPAVKELARRADGEELFRLRSLLLRDPRPGAREALAWAARLRPDFANATLLGLVLRKDRAAPVRRAAARALVHFKDRRAVSALVAALATEADRRARLAIADTLRRLTPAPCLLDAGAWRDWWAVHERDPRFVPADEGPRRGEYEGVVLETRTVAPVPSGRRGTGRRPPHLLVLPAFGWRAASYGPYLLPLRARAFLTWVRLPTVQQLTGRTGYGDDIPVYPVERLVRALERFRAVRGIERFVVVAQGASGWIAMRYAVSCPRRCAGLVLIDTALDKQAYASALRRAAAHGDRGERFVARTLLHENNVAFSARTLDRLQAIGLAHGYADPGDLEIGWQFDHAREPQGFATVPEIRWARRRRVEVPSLFLYSAASPFSGHVDADRIQRHFPDSLVAPLRHATGLPFVETNAAFHRVLDAWLDRLR